jgi:ATP-dependent protease ClpP protease subunit
VVRRNKPTGSAARFAAAWAELPEAEQRRMNEEIRAALRGVKSATTTEVDAEAEPTAAIRPRQITNRSDGAQVYPIRCQIRNEADVTRVDVMDDIGEGWFDEGLTAKSFAAQLSGVKGALEVHINSGGGDVFDGIAIGNAIRAHRGPVVTVVDGIAASIASVIAQAGKDRVVQPGGMLMCHDAFGMAIGNAAEMAKMAQTLDQVSDNIASIYASRSGRGTQQQWRDAMREETWYTAEEAVAAGLADRVGDEPAQLPPGLDLAAYTAMPGRIAAALRTMPIAKAPADTGSRDPLTPQLLAEVRSAFHELKEQW